MMGDITISVIRRKFQGCSSVDLIKGSSGHRRVYKIVINGRNIIVKTFPNLEDARNEAEITKKARDLLERYNLRVPVIEGMINEINGIIFEYIDGSEPDLDVETQLNPCISYLARLNTIVDNGQFENKDHYYGNTLVNRLKQENDFREKAKIIVSSLQRFDQSFSRALKEALRVAEDNSPPVITHGDIQKKNIRIDNGEVILLDWCDFGIAHQSY